MNALQLALGVAVLVEVVFGQESCTSRQTCGDCIQQPGCYWCSEIDFSGKSHCRDLKELPSCSAGNAISPVSQKVRDDRNEPLQLGGKVQVQISPQESTVMLRMGEEYEFNFQYGHAPNFPIDLYYLMDLSNSMAGQKKSLANLGDELIKTMKNITQDFRVGFGSFVDKTEMPFVSTVPARLKEPCKGCVPAYSFINHHSLSSGDNFTREVRNAKVSGNLDTPEGGFDALMQAMVCKKEIGWRDTARHLIIFSTDAVFHIAGDGKLAGVVEPNDAKCHMSKDKYTDGLIYDYPSVSQINYVAKEGRYNIFFAIVEKAHVYKVYEELKKQIENSGIAPLKENTNSNITALIVDFYDKISSTIKMEDDYAPNDIEIKYSCRKADGSDCNELHSGNIVNYTAKIRLLDCKNKTTRRVTIRAGTLDVKTVINLQPVCDCDCEHEEHVALAPECKDKGGLKCGVCSCNEGYYGKNCECDGEHDFSSDVTPCINENETKPCSDRGKCKCGTCECNKLTDPSKEIYGKYCECDNYSCLKAQGSKLCSGNGRCQCGLCVCNAGWNGESCGCKDDPETCTINGKICNDKGACECGECKCERGFYGKNCEECATCSGGRCDELKPCVDCKVFNNGDYKDECDVKCAQFPITFVDEIDDIDSENIKVCRYQVENNCNIVFKYFYVDKVIQIEARKELQCPKAIVVELVFGLIGSILLAGLIALIIWKIYTFIHDKREYAKFENERAGSKWNTDNNPLFKSPVTKFSNPTYTAN